jgi:DNA-binding LacI/PurR family transcriptional regulator
VHDALTPLVKEGLLERTPRVGTFVRQREQRLTRVGIYDCGSLWTVPTSTFGRSLCSELHEQLLAIGMTDTVWMDPRPFTEQNTPWGELERAAAERRIQALLVPSSDIAHTPWLDKLSVPVVFLGGHAPLRNRIGFDDHDWADKALGLLREQGCRTVGAISARKVQLTPAGEPVEGHTEFYRQLRAAAARLELDLRPEWILHVPPEGLPGNGVAFQQFGFDAMRRLWHGDTRPDGLAVFEDVTAGGVIMAAMQERIDVPSDLKLALHRNAEIGLFCPFPAGFVDVRVTEVAAAMIDQMQRLYAGDEAEPVLLAHHAVSAPTARSADECLAAATLPPISELEYAVNA